MRSSGAADGDHQDTCNIHRDLRSRGLTHAGRRSRRSLRRRPWDRPTAGSPALPGWGTAADRCIRREDRRKQQHQRHDPRTAEALEDEPYGQPHDERADGGQKHKRQSENLLNFVVGNYSVSSSGSEDIRARMISPYSRSGDFRNRSVSMAAMSSRGIARRRSITLPMSSDSSSRTV